MHHWKPEQSCNSIDNVNPKIVGPTLNHPCVWKSTVTKHTKASSKNASASIRNPTHRDDAMKQKKPLVCASCNSSNLFVK
mmetsp:Transcript_3498/g.7548  ORF Transcript_3498/g.7548 Transcript_3498/m.7548 type:complete len:80 (+) Transcript_3498:944-1183(+)